jgi:hypothetical protein
MSIKTLKKRIAVVAVSALTVGVLSVVSTPTAIAAAPDHNAISNDASSGASVSASADILNIATLQGLSATVAASGGTTGTSNGLLAVSTTPGVTGTATVLATGALSVYTAAPGGGDLPVIVVSGATITSATSATGTITYNSGQTAILNSADAALAAVIKPNAGVGSFVISYYNGASATLTSPGALKTQYIVTVAASSASGVYSAADSDVSLSNAYQATTLSTGDVSGATTTIALTGTGYINFSLKDSYDQPLAAGALVAQSAKGSFVSIVSSSGSASTSTVDVDSSTPTNLAVRVDNATPGVPVADTITLTYKGTVVATRSIGFVGKAASFTISKIAVNTLSATIGDSNNTFRADLKDAAGNLLLATSRESFWSDDSGANNFVTDVAVDAAAAISAGVYASAYGTHSCGSSAGTASIVLRYVNTDGSIVKSAPFTLSCAGAAYTYSASFDKASYVTGEIAKLTVSFKDSKGNVANDFDAIPANVSGNRYVEASFPQLTIVGADPSTTQTPEGGVIELKFAVGTSTGITPGTWSGTVNVASLNDPSLLYN